MPLDPNAIMWSFAQNFEDVMLARALATVETGFYVDVGAWHPESDSVTHHFYSCGWRGVNVEPNPHYLRLLEAARPRDCNLGVAVGGIAGRSAFTIIHDTGMSTLDPAIAAMLPDNAWRKELVDIEVRTLNAIFAQHATGEVHFLKIDCEGSEGAVVTAFDFARNRPWIVLVEATRPLSTEPTFEGWEPHLLRNGYDFVYFDGVNRFYVAREHSELKEHFAVPPNVFDNFIIARMAVASAKRARESEGPAWRSRVQRLFRAA